MACCPTCWKRLPQLTCDRSLWDLPFSLYLCPPPPPPHLSLSLSPSLRTQGLPSARFPVPRYFLMQLTPACTGSSTDTKNSKLVAASVFLFTRCLHLSCLLSDVKPWRSIPAIRFEFSVPITLQWPSTIRVKLKLFTVLITWVSIRAEINRTCTASLWFTLGVLTQHAHLQQPKQDKRASKKCHCRSHVNTITDKKFSRECSTKRKVGCRLFFRLSSGFNQRMGFSVRKIGSPGVRASGMSGSHHKESQTPRVSRKRPS